MNHTPIFLPEGRNEKMGREGGGEESFDFLLAKRAAEGAKSPIIFAQKGWERKRARDFQGENGTETVPIFDLLLLVNKWYLQYRFEHRLVNMFFPLNCNDTCLGEP